MLSNPGKLISHLELQFILCTVGLCGERANTGIAFTRNVICLHDDLKPQFTTQVKAKTSAMYPLKWNLAYPLILKGH